MDHYNIRVWKDPDPASFFPHPLPAREIFSVLSRVYPASVGTPLEVSHTQRAAGPSTRPFPGEPSMMKLSQGSVWGGKPKPNPRTAPNGPDLPQSDFLSTEEMAKEDQEASKGKEGIRGEGGAVLPLH